MDLSLLNSEQKRAVLQTEGPVLVLAGAGSGKTRVIAHRVVHLIEEGVPARAILAVTFTNKAAAEMKERIVKLAGDRERTRGLTVSTFHAFGVRVVREQHDQLGLPQKFAILDSGDQAALVKRLLREVKIDDKRFDVQRLLSIISRLRMNGAEGHGGAGSAGDGRRPKAAASGGAGSAGDGRRPKAAASGGAGSAGDGRRPKAAVSGDDEYELAAAELLPRYQLGLRAMGATDFDDLLLLPLRIFREQPEVLQKYQKRHRYLLVDEYQDTNGAQLQLLELLAGLRRNLCVVGDDDQSIYAWRGAQVRHILQFDKKFPGCVEIFLEQNYRSNGNILDAANAVIGKNPGRKPKKLWTDRGRGPNLRLVCAPDDAAEAKHIADEIVRISYEEKIPLHEMAVLYRTNAQARPLEEALRLAGVRYRVVGGTSLFDRKEVRDLIAYLRAALNPRDELALLRIVNVPARGIGDATVARAQQLARARKCTVWEVFASAPPELGHAAERIAEFVAVMGKYGERLSRRGFSEAARALVEEVGLFEEARRGAQSLAAQARRIEAIESLLGQLIEYEKREEQRAAQRNLQPEARGPKPEASEPAASAPAEADDETFAAHSGRGFDDASGEPRADGTSNLEEERRLCYVGFTRARERLILTRAAERVKRGKATPRTPSRFLEDIPPALVDVIDLAGPHSGSAKEVQQTKAKSFFAAMDDLLREDPG